MTGQKVSIIVPAYNCASYINQCIESVLNQTHQNWELIIVVSPSTDDTLSRANRYIDERIYVIDEEKKTNVATARNTGFAYATGRYVAFLDSDDWWDANKLHECLNYMGLLDYPPMVTHYMYMEYPRKRIECKTKPGHDTEIGGTGTVIFRRDYLNRVRIRDGYIFNELMNSNDDADLMLRCRNDYCATIPQFFSHMRMRSDGITGTTSQWKNRKILLEMLIRNRCYDLLAFHVKSILLGPVVTLKKRIFP
jgi:glycosyltransferase involved in cell wall biosynthesis